MCKSNKQYLLCFELCFWLLPPLPRLNLWAAFLSASPQARWGRRINTRWRWELPLIVFFKRVCFGYHDNPLGAPTSTLWIDRGFTSELYVWKHKPCLIPCDGREAQMQSLIHCFLGIMAALLLRKHGIALFYHNIASFTHSTHFPGVWRLENKLMHLPLHRLGDTAEIPEDTLFFPFFKLLSRQTLSYCYRCNTCTDSFVEIHSLATKVEMYVLISCFAVFFIPAVSRCRKSNKHFFFCW